METDDEYMVKRKCMSCESDYTHEIDCKYSEHIDTYCKWLGLCSTDCFDKLPKTEKNLVFLRGFFGGLGENEFN